MSAQLVFFSEPRHRVTDPTTSHDAAVAVASHAGGLENRILEAFAIYGPLTDDELCEAIPDAYQPTLKTARSRLSNRGVLVATGATRPSFRGRLMTVWSLV